VTRLLQAARYLTIVPLPQARAPDSGSPGAAATWFPVIGLAIGLLVVGTTRLTSQIFPPLLSALLTVTVWKLVTGGLHLDGLADCLDGLVGRDVEQRLSIMSDSRIGAFGAIGLILFLMLEIAAVAELPPGPRWRALLVAPAVGRAMPALVAVLFPAAKPAGHGASFRAGLRREAVPIGLGIAVLVAAFLLGAGGIVAVAVACLVTVALSGLLARRLGGVTGDVLGTGVEVGELTVLLTVSAWTHGR
jgi:adenosylcobinamide-GDP ribazoletransferase